MISSPVIVEVGPRLTLARWGCQFHLPEVGKKMFPFRQKWSIKDNQQKKVIVSLRKSIGSLFD